jgi:ABC-type Fe3+ transport system substrate-binding protein
MHTTGTALAELSSALDADAWDALVTGLAANRPLLVGDNERAVLEVATGSRWIGLSNMNVARRIRAESPVRHVFLDPSPCIPAFGLLVRGARNPELGRRFLEWLTTEPGQQAFAAAGRVACLPEVGIPAFARLAGQQVRPLFGTVDWVTDPSPWAERFRSRFVASDEPVRYGKLSNLELTREEGIRALG